MSVCLFAGRFLDLAFLLFFGLQLCSQLRISERGTEIRKANLWVSFENPASLRGNPVKPARIPIPECNASFAGI